MQRTDSIAQACSPDLAGAQPDQVKIGLIIVDYHSWSESRQAIASALASRRPFDRIVVVDNGGTVPEQECGDLSERLKFIRAGHNGGYAYGVNLGLRLLQAEGAAYAMVVNPDVRLREDTLEKLLEVVERHPDFAIVGPVVYRDEAATTIEFAGADALWHLGWLRQRNTVRPHDGAVTDEPFVLGCSWLMRMALLEEIGELPEGYFLYFEETDYCQSVRRLGHRVGIVPGAGCVHHGSWSVKKGSPLFRYQLARNRIWFMRRWARADQYASFVLITALAKVPLAILLFGLRDRNWQVLWAFLHGTWHGLRLPVFATLPDRSHAADSPRAPGRNGRD